MPKRSLNDLKSRVHLWNIIAPLFPPEAGQPLFTFVARKERHRRESLRLPVAFAALHHVVCDDSLTCTPLNRLRSTSKQRKLVFCLQVNTRKLVFLYALIDMSKVEVGCQCNATVLFVTWMGCLM